MTRLGDTWANAPGPGDLTRTGDPQNQTPGACPACEGDHPVSRCPAVARMFTAPPRRTETKEAPVAIKRDLSDLPPAGLAPDPSPRFAGLLAEWWSTRPDDHVPSGKAFRHSDAGKCARALSYRIAGIPCSDPMDLPGWHNVELGTLIHDAWQEALPAMFTVERAQSLFDDRTVVDVQVAIEVGVEHEAIDSIGYVDAVVTVTFDGDHEPHVIALELKSVGGWKHKNAIGKARKNSPAEGPDTGHLLQAALNGLAVGADEVVVAYIAKECLSATQYRDADPLARFVAEWAFTREQYVPLAERELERVAAVIALGSEGLLAPRKLPDMPPRSEITDPSTGDWEQRIDGEVTDTGNAWACAYCPYQTVCLTTEAGRIPVESVVATKAVA